MSLVYECNQCHKETFNGDMVEGHWICAKCQKNIDDTNRILLKVIAHYGEPAQVLKCIEELAELGIELSGTITADNKYFRKDMVDLVRCLTNVVNFCKYDIPSTTSEIRMLPSNEERYSDIVQETADVRIMLQQLEMFLVSPEEVHDQIDFKVKRLEERIEGDSK